MSRATIVFLVLLFLVFSSIESAKARPLATLSDSTTSVTTAATKSQNKDFVEESCEGVEKEECLMRRTLADAHLDYIYTQSKKP
ncbi:hypothetical protein OSB04_007439 [Centaurea solstitialis]|uniref:Phytosulfokine n=1 Tax=Centaurea solstitialis TaxID=347529 RepID=A0AA38WSK8_9ASTR|nr:hypothetical protein OSB04_007439 [Centaurea solstitialis]